MYLKVMSPDALIFEGEVEKVVIPTMAGDIGILPRHIPLSSIIRPGIVRILPTDKNANEFIKGTKFLFDHDEITLSVGKGLLYLDGQTVVMLVGAITTIPISDEAVLEEMKKNMEKEIEQIKLQGDIDEIDKAYLSLQKITADLKLYNIHKHRL
ncbi:MAG: hypothetical protein CO170_00670 [candidate division SR1 bacterium CG_4_9_14_3_um_filter_40_9]|nr:MAG: hypothetical protein CO170_00670 [candidate division SR1 bacterium CG_4_9_14_3_um_filter_40_9]